MGFRLTPMKLAFLALLLFGPNSVAASDCGLLVKRRGSVEILRLDAAGQLESGHRVGRVMKSESEPVACDDIVVTRARSSVLIILAHARVAVGPDSRLEIASLVDGTAGSKASSPKADVIRLTYGRVRVVVPPEASPPVGRSSRFQIQTRTAVVGVRGTDFFASYEMERGNLRQATLTGEVAVALRSRPEAPIVVGAGRQVLIPKDSAEAPLPLPTAIEPQLLGLIRSASAAAVGDPAFESKAAESILGPSSRWGAQREMLPDELRDVEKGF
jgi:hypothetical protein